MTRCIHISPELPPTVGGVADYTSILSQRLVEAADGEVEPVLVQAGQNAEQAPEVDFESVDLGGQCSASALAATITRLAAEADGRAVVLLEYSGYGYAQGGAPLWLLRALWRVCGQASGLPLITVFHELYAASYKPWERAFWTWPVQYGVAALLARLSVGSTANWVPVARSLSRWTRRPVHVSPTFSNVGEPEALPAYDERQPYAVCFGAGAGRKREMYAQRGLGSALQALGIERIVDIGTQVSAAVTEAFPMPVEQKGFLPAEEVSTLLRHAAAGIVRYPLHCITKSGIWASYAAHGVPALLIAKRQPVENLREGDHFLLLQPLTEGARPPRLASISRNARAWYQKNAHSKKAVERLNKLFPCEG